MIKRTDILKAKERIAPYIRETPVEYAQALQQEFGINVHFKLENLQVSGSFKPRGGFNKILKNSTEEFVAPTAGGHGVGLSYAANQLGAKVHILMPKTADSDRIKDIEANGATIQFFDTVPEARAKAKALEAANNYVFVSAFNDTEMVEGGGTIAVELLEQLPNMDCLVCGVGGGGYIAGMGILLKAINPDIKIYGVQQENAPFLAEWFKHKTYPKELIMQPSIAEGIGAEVEEDSITWPYIEELVDDFFVVSEEEIRDSLLWLLKAHKHYVEPSAVVGLAAIRKYPEHFKKFKSVCTILTGRNMSFDKFQSILDK
ncbi:MAG: pyridoxal-phosphate dependent enzyme [Reichenbachiella sp.]|uniref:threonine ammonia-lyase n=1 Tax=Reichenbachiella sp. TaxID=2184521 RepID=UPI003298CF5A